MTTSISLRKYDATACIIFTELGEMRLGELCSSNPLRNIRRRRNIPPLMHTVHFYRIFNFFSAMPRYDNFATFTAEETCRLMHTIDTNSIFSVSYSTTIIPICQVFIEKSRTYIEISSSRCYNTSKSIFQGILSL